MILLLFSLLLCRVSLLNPYSSYQLGPCGLWQTSRPPMRTPCHERQGINVFSCWNAERWK